MNVSLILTEKDKRKKKKIERKEARKEKKKKKSNNNNKRNTSSTGEGEQYENGNELVCIVGLMVERRSFRC